MYRNIFIPILFTEMLVVDVVINDHQHRLPHDGGYDSHGRRSGNRLRLEGASFGLLPR
jgi:hypothetical protein